MLLISARVKPSAIHGLGCFAAEPVRKGQVVWRFDPRIDLLIPADEEEGLPLPTREFLEIYGYTVERDGGRYIVLCGDHSRHMNHSDDPNLLEGGDENELNIAARDIVEGEELTCDYRLFDIKARSKMGK